MFPVCVEREREREREGLSIRMSVRILDVEK
jgi:hypothetical protein